MSFKPLGILMITAMAAACGGGGDGSGPGPRQQDDQVTESVGPAGGTVVTPSGAAGVKIPPGTFTGNVAVTVARIETTQQPGSGPLPTSLKQYGPFYEFSTSPQVAQFGDSVRVGVCQVTDPSSPYYAPEPHSTLRLAHTVGSSIEILEPAGVNDFLRCTNVTAGNEANSSLFARAFNKLLRPAMLYAAHGGLGGKTKSFSPFGAVQTTESSVRFTSISAGSQFTCALTDAGRAYCWGTGPENQNTRTRPAAVSTQVTFTGITASWDHACALSSGNSLFCWGQNGFGQVGNGTTNSPVYPPEGVFGARGFATGLSTDHTCALDFSTNRAFC